MSDVVYNPKSGFDEIHAGGETRKLSLTPPKAATLMAIPRFGSANEVIPEAKWKQTNRLQTLGDRLPRYNQGQVGECEPTSEVECIGGCRASAGLAPVRLSPSMLYACINGGRDQGAGMGDGYAFMLANDLGVCLESTMPHGFYLPQQVTAKARAESRLHRPREGYHAQSFQEIASAILRDAWPNVGVAVSNRWELDAQGCIPVVRGQPNHAITAIDLVKLPASYGGWGFLSLNHWGQDWGMTGPYAGCCIVPRKAYEATTFRDSIVYQGVTVDADADLPPRPHA